MAKGKNRPSSRGGSIEIRRSILKIPVPERVNYEPGIWSKTSWIQIGYGVWVTLPIVAIGMTYGFSSVALPTLNKEMNLTVGEGGWIVGTVTVIAPVGCIISGILMDRIGRRIMMIVCVLPIALGWFLTGTASDAKGLIIGRVVTSLGNGLASGVPRTYCTEMSLPMIRGVIGVFPAVALSFGITLEALLGSFLMWRTLCYIGGGYCVFLMFFNCFLPETPYYTLLNSTIEQTEYCLRKFRGKVSRIDLELEEMKRYKRTNDIKKLTFTQSLKAIMTPAACLPFWYMIIFVLFGQLSGTSIVLFYGVLILQESKLSYSFYIGNIILTLARFFGALLCSILSYTVDRRPLALTSAGGVFLTCIISGSFFITLEEPTAMPVICFSVFMIFANLGYLSLPSLMLYELIPLQIRGLLGGIMVSCWTFSMFCVHTAFPYVMNAIGLRSAIIAFGIVSFFGTLIF